ncbi:DUF2267 domain-containing protein [Halarchaeum sp. P4]|uniref:DUF2267 domain-containing protein n=1 Tax=Halarchaeum sp. P4 TaxID=3421639 RepID=UPI003EBAFADA
MTTDLITQVQKYETFRSDEQTAQVVDAVLETLSERLSEGEADDLAALLDDPHADTLRGPAPRHPQEYTLAEFLDHVEQRADVDHGGREVKTAAVCSALADLVPGQELSRVRDQLPDDYDRLFEADKS